LKPGRAVTQDGKPLPCHATDQFQEAFVAWSINWTRPNYRQGHSCPLCRFQCYLLAFELGQLIDVPWLEGGFLGCRGILGHASMHTYGAAVDDPAHPGRSAEFD
jgi:hypothetical protein